MIATARYELEIIRRDRRAWWSLACLGILILLSFASINLEVKRGDADKRIVATAERARWLGQGAKDPHSAAHYSVFVFKPTPRLALLDPGVSAFVGQAVWLEAHHQNDMLYRPRQDASLFQRAGLISPAGLIISLAPLIVFLLAFTLVAQDRERGTMRMALGAALHPRVIVHAKTLAIWAVTTGLLILPVTLLAMGTVLGFGAAQADTLLRLFLWALLMSSYLALLAAVGVAVALRAGNARIALSALAGLWIVFALVLPRAASSAADALRPLPSSQKVRQEILDQAPAYWSAEAAQRQKAQLLAKYKVESLEQIPNPRMAELDLVERHSHQTFDRILGDFYRRVAAQDWLFSTFSVFSPAIAVQSLSAAVSGTDFTQHHHFITTSERYRRDLVNRMNADGMAHKAHGAERHTNDAQLWSQIPDFDYRQPELGTANGTALPALAILFLWLGAAWLILRAASRGLKP